jgi:hypothetical protein
MEIIKHREEPTAFIIFIIVMDIGFVLFHISGFLFGIVVERWEKEEKLEEEQDNPYKV